MTDQVKQTLRDSAAVRWTALLLLALAMFCAYIFMDILSPIKDLMLTQRGWDSTAFGTMQGSETFLNVFVFFLIFAGIILATLFALAGPYLMGRAIDQCIATGQAQGLPRIILSMLVVYVLANGLQLAAS